MMAKVYNTMVRFPNFASPGADIDLQRSHDVLPPNPRGRDKPEDDACRRRKLVNCRRAISISTMNVRTIRKQHYREELVLNRIECNIGVLGIQEHRIIHEEPVRYESILDRTLITTSATKNKARAATGGVDIVLNNYAKNSLASVRSYDDRILIANFPRQRSNNWLL